MIIEFKAKTLLIRNMINKAVNLLINNNVNHIAHLTNRSYANFAKYFVVAFVILLMFLQSAHNICTSVVAEADIEKDSSFITSLEIIHDPDKLTYHVGESLDLSGLVVHITAADGHKVPVDNAELKIMGFDSTIEGSIQEIVVTYDEFFDTFTISVQTSKTFISKITENPFMAMVLTAILLFFVILLSSVLKRKKQKSIDQNVIRHTNNSSAVSKSVIGQKIPVHENNQRYLHGHSDHQSSAQHKHKKKRRKWLLIIPVVFLALLLIGYGGLLNLLSGFDRETITTDDDELGIDEGISDKNITNIAVFGIDSTDGMNGRSDTIMILTLDEKHDKIKITSIVRDSYVDIPDRGMDKINHAYAFGGPELAIKTINQNFKLDIRHYISLNFSSMPAIVDTLGGVEVEITDKEAALISGVSSKGTYKLNGKQALQFARIRKIDSDFERSRRQRDVMEATIKAAFDKPITSYPGMLSEIFPYMKTNLSSNQMLNLGRKTVMNNIRDIEQVQFPLSSLGKGEIINGIYYYVFDRTIGATILSQYIFEDKTIDG